MKVSDRIKKFLKDLKGANDVEYQYHKAQEKKTESKTVDQRKDEQKNEFKEAINANLDYKKQSEFATKNESEKKEIYVNDVYDVELNRYTERIEKMEQQLEEARMDSDTKSVEYIEKRIEELKEKMDKLQNEEEEKIAGIEKGKPQEIEEEK